MQHVILCKMENRVFFYSVISELGDASNINRSQIVTTWRQKAPIMNENIDNLSKFDYIIKRYTIRITHKALKNLDKMPKPEQEKFFRLKTALETRGPEQPSFMNYSKLGMNMYHCHLSRKWVACWKNESGTLTIEVYYVGSRESAPYARH